mmetsp:Transcript_90827/g.243238  ORF Transcript_90827/g.243238 Transcript_90827/m.243238 type:complete len:320 (-) Transcript_90827:87-1046(-)
MVAAAEGRCRGSLFRSELGHGVPVRKVDAVVSVSSIQWLLRGENEAALLRALMGMKSAAGDGPVVCQVYPGVNDGIRLVTVARRVWPAAGLVASCPHSSGNRAIKLFLSSSGAGPECPVAWPHKAACRASETMEDLHRRHLRRLDGVVAQFTPKQVKPKPLAKKARLALEKAAARAEAEAEAERAEAEESGETVADLAKAADVPAWTASAPPPEMISDTIADTNSPATSDQELVEAFLLGEQACRDRGMSRPWEAQKDRSAVLAAAKAELRRCQEMACFASVVFWCAECKVDLKTEKALRVHMAAGRHRGARGDAQSGE